MTKTVDLTWNGCLVQGRPIEMIKDISPYRGAAFRKSWMLDTCETAKGQEFTKRMNMWFYHWYEDGELSVPSLWVCPDIALTREYLRYCVLIGYSIHLLLCTSKRTFPQLSPESMATIDKQPLQFLGYDYIGAALDYSTIPDELLVNCPSALKIFRHALNAYGLFSSWETIEEYVTLRRTLLEQGEPLENDAGLCIIGLYHMDYTCLL